MVKLNDIAKQVRATVYHDARVSIVAVVYTQTGTVEFAGYIDGEFVPFSRSEQIASTIRAINSCMETEGF